MGEEIMVSKRSKKAEVNALQGKRIVVTGRQSHIKGLRNWKGVYISNRERDRLREIECRERFMGKVEEIVLRQREVEGTSIGGACQCLAPALVASPVVPQIDNVQGPVDRSSPNGTSIGASCTVYGTGSSGSPCSAPKSQCTGSIGEGLGTCSCSDGNYLSDTNVCSPNGTSIGASCTVYGTFSSGSPCSAPKSQCTGSIGEGPGTCSCSDGNYLSDTNVCSPMGISIGGLCIVPGISSGGLLCSAPNSQCTGSSGEGLGSMNQ
ncbi:LOW QUALITY PROTEIN: hypothetical protein MAR_018108 [Mya arenaria]|uniref:Uncharacterized protein n=1 Tax=Mya arenaria TaxID=6604 RepID=A0ABY7EDP5_MYAAR|nr:LOW QUALITY PROTEIN: hypothetical protein MAR_018108 [Mya arenaria]